MSRRPLPRLASPSVLAGVVSMSGCAAAQEPWPNLDEAEASPRAAPAALDRAPDRFGGHEAEAERPIREAMLEVEQAGRPFR